jgi:hypothetical protein
LLAELLRGLETSTSRLRIVNQICNRHRESETGTHLALGNGILNLVNLDLAEPLDLQQCASSRRVNSLPNYQALNPILLSTSTYSNGVISVRLELCNINCADTMGLDCININDEAVLFTVSGSVLQ